MTPEESKAFDHGFISAIVVIVIVYFIYSVGYQAGSSYVNKHQVCPHCGVMMDYVYPEKSK